MEKNKNLKSLEQLRKEKGKTHWASLIVENKEQPDDALKKHPKNKR